MNMESIMTVRSINHNLDALRVVLVDVNINKAMQRINTERASLGHFTFKSKLTSSTMSLNIISRH